MIDSWNGASRETPIYLGQAYVDRTISDRSMEVYAASGTNVNPNSAIYKGNVRFSSGRGGRKRLRVYIEHSIDPFLLIVGVHFVRAAAVHP